MFVVVVNESLLEVAAGKKQFIPVDSVSQTQRGIVGDQDMAIADLIQRHKIERIDVGALNYQCIQSS